MTQELEGQLRAELTEVAARTQVSPDAYRAIVSRAATPPAAGARRRWAAPGAWAAVLLVAVVAVVLLGRAQGSDRGSVVAGDSAPTPPALEGHADIQTVAAPCQDCPQGWFRLQLADPPRSPELLLPPSKGRHVFSDGRYISEAPSGEAVVVHDSGMEIRLGGRLVSASEGHDGSVVVVTSDPGSPRTSRLSLLAPGSGTALTVGFPGDLVPHAAAVAADGEVLVLADVDDCCLNRPVLVVLSGDGQERRRHTLTDALPSIPTFSQGLALSVNATGMAAISSGGLASSAVERSATVVIDSESGSRLALLAGWRGVAWSPDGRGLLAARTVDDGSSALAVFWGEGFAERLEVGIVDLHAFPRRWHA